MAKNYQDIYSQGKVERKGVRECAERYEALKIIFSQFNRPFSILDIGANYGYFSIRAAEEFGATSTMIEAWPKHVNKLKSLCVKNKNLNLTLLHKRVSGEDLRKLAECERFDVVLVFNVLHHIKDWQKAAEAVLDLGDIVAMETPPEDDRGACGKKRLKPIFDFFHSKEHEHLGYFSRHTDAKVKSEMIKLEGTKKNICKSFFGDKRKGHDPKINITSDFNKRVITKTMRKKHTNKVAVSNYNWVHGVNLQTYLKFNGVFPTKKEIKRKLKKREINTLYKWDDSHGDIKPWNFVLNGSQLNLIDIDGKKYSLWWNSVKQKRSDQLGIDITLALIDGLEIDIRKGQPSIRKKT